ncbi:NAD(P)-dependent oxidoreductase [Nonomuraea fuscirosea]|jgi:3-hydroxyisobutyrate dehydrogenase|uniref:NAD(P)-dependent oxidoreductase n=1 Tax=Nonomuraea fuscirosea TaxID=1291556 RepID=UPI002DD7A0C4|nr:NAD(P)-dependent oxidoreductase [Nonomuraea fuscirosea]WSA54625.1 NAD(P)-dependent oxidoreductase [Nonomuraea fuscirosea]
MTVVAVLGAGIMGLPMARNLAGAGLRVRAWNRTRDKALPLEADGVAVADAPAGAVEGADVIVTMLSDGDAVHDAISAAAPGLRPGQVWAQMSTVGVDAVGRLAALAGEHGLTFVDAPVQGTRQPAEQGTLVILAAGPQAARQALEPVFAALGQRTLWLGEDGAGGAATRLKMATVSFSISMTAVVAEALSLAEGLGLDPGLVRQVIAGGPLDSAYFQAKSQAILEGDFTPSFSVRNAEKDTRLITSAGETAGVRLDLVAAAGERFRRAEAAGHGDEDMAATYFASFGPGRDSRRDGT